MRKVCFCFTLMLAAILFVFNSTAVSADDDADFKATYISPNNDGVRDTLKINPVVKKEQGLITEWHLYILDGAGKAVKTISNKEIKELALSADASIKDNAKAMLKAITTKKQSVIVPKQVVWDGTLDDGNVAPDGRYQYYFSATGSNGLTNETSKYNVVVDNTPPSVTVSQPSAAEKFFGEGSKKTLTIRETGSVEDKWLASITDNKGEVVKEFDIANAAPANIIWDGSDKNGKLCPDGIYTYSIESTDRAGNKSSPARVTNIMYSGNADLKAWVTTASETIAPNGKTKTQKFALSTSQNTGIDSWTFSVLSADNKKAAPIKSESGKGDTLQQNVEWDGKDQNGKIVEGKYLGSISISYLNGGKADGESPAFICSASAPKLTVNVTTEHFSPDNDGDDDDCNINLGAKSLLPFDNWTFDVYDTSDPSSDKKGTANTVFWNVSGKSKITELLVWNGKSNKRELVQSAMDYPYVFTVTDIEGQTSQVSGYISVDILVMLIDNKLKMQVPSIIFRADHADFLSKKEDPKQGLDQSIIDNNVKWLKRIAQVLNKFKDYTVVVEGHANAFLGTAAEEKENGPFSKQRADFVRTQLIKYGVKGDRLSTIGMGGTKPVADTKDPNTRWKNRRVEFILNR
ncbi:MAG: hypothetical protein Ta2B_01680 [Termitinemataceae bacterium]|nr:MAG: hypothetical protein Ta2B_01680 [Termitinemataceae bacterium]